MLVEGYLNELGCEVVGMAWQLEDAMEDARTLVLDVAALDVAALGVAVLDVNLAGRLSHPVAQALHARDVPVLFATGYVTEGLPAGLQKAAVTSKPVRQQQLA